MKHLDKALKYLVNGAERVPFSDLEDIAVWLKRDFGRRTDSEANDIKKVQAEVQESLKRELKLDVSLAKKEGARKNTKKSRSEAPVERAKNDHSTARILTARQRNLQEQIVL